MLSIVTIAPNARARCTPPRRKRGILAQFETGWDLFKLILDVASGRKKVWSEHWGIVNDLALFNPGPVT
jgi:hypothetical protein